jgi:hypothetical protein
MSSSVKYLTPAQGFRLAGQIYGDGFSKRQSE